jgi:hypothetical protein
VSEYLPSKLTPVTDTVLGYGALLLETLGSEGRTPGQLWIQIRSAVPSLSYTDFVDALTLLFAAGLVDERNGMIIGGPRAAIN